MDLRQLEMFKAITDAGSFTRAGRRLHVSQSAVSRQITLLEEELGVQVFMRSGRRVFLTEAGKTLLKHCHRIFRDMEEAALEVAQNKQSHRGSLRVGGGMSVCTYLLPQILKEYKTRYPHVQLTVTTGTTEPTIQKIRNNEIDVGVLSLPVESQDLQVRSVFREEMMVVTGPSHPLREKRHITPRDLASAPLILFERGSNTRKVIDRFFEEQSLAPDIIMEMENVEIIKPLVEIGLGITIIPYQSIVREVEAGTLHFSRISGHRLYRELGLVFLKMHYLPIPLQRMVTLFTEMIPTLQVVPP
ncbi:MAG: LysR family transcriptional regulator [candidate division Zixibacteria bacterium]|nr:LysR family transcriptional regulator [candidate division Zixibacteria bacterium]